MNKCYSIRKFDKNGNLVAYAEFNDSLFRQPKCFYKADGEFLNRIHVNEHYDSGQPVYESVNSFIEFNDNIMLSPIVINGETRLNPIASASTCTYTQPDIVDRFDTYKNLSSNDVNIESFRLQEAFVDDYLNRF